METVSSPFSRFISLVGEESFHDLSSRSVLVVGVGGVGGYVVEGLVRSGIGHIIIIDGDVVDISNINHQIIALHSTIGESKVEVFKKRILDINPNCQVESISNFLTKDNICMLEALSFDFLVDACDMVSTKKEIISYCKKRDIPFLTCLGTAKKLDPSMLEVTTIDKTYNDPLARILRHYVNEERLGRVDCLFSRELPNKIPELGSSAFVPSSAGLMIAGYVVNYFMAQKKK